EDQDERDAGDVVDDMNQPVDVPAVGRTVLRQPPVKHARRASWLLLLHLDRDLRWLPGLDLDLFRLLAERLVPYLDRVLSGRDVLDLGGAVGTGHAEERIRHDGDPPEHPAV